MSTHHAEAGVDMTQPTSSILNTGTRKIHDEVVNSKGASHLTKGELDREEYTRYLMMLWHIYTYVFSSTLTMLRQPISGFMRPPLVRSRRVWLQMPTTASSPRRTILL